VQLPTSLIAGDLVAGTLVDVLPDWTLRSGIVHAVFPTRRGLLPAVRSLVDFLALEFAALSRAERQQLGGLARHGPASSAA
jgi:DNA-binding transcriptional LysR family regulator